MNRDTRRFVLVHQQARARAIQAVSEAPDGFTVVVAPQKRNTTINAALHASLDEIAERIEWAGRKWDSEVWKRLLTAAWSRSVNEHVVILPAIDGQGVDIVFRRTSEMSQAEMRELLAYVDAWKAERPEFQETET